MLKGRKIQIYIYYKIFILVAWCFANGKAILYAAVREKILIWKIKECSIDRYVKVINNLCNCSLPLFLTLLWLFCWQTLVNIICLRRLDLIMPCCQNCKWWSNLGVVLTAEACQQFHTVHWLLMAVFHLKSPLIIRGSNSSSFLSDNNSSRNIEFICTHIDLNTINGHALQLQLYVSPKGN